MINTDVNNFDKIREAEKWLYNYKSIKAGIESLKEEYDNPIGSRTKINTSREFALESRIKSMERKVEQMDRALAALNNVEREVITSLSTLFNAAKALSICSTFLSMLFILLSSANSLDVLIFVLLPMGLSYSSFKLSIPAFILL